jgi:transcriptional regulator with XRE-family HTH domain
VTVSFGTQLRQCREAAGISMSELARRINYSKSYLSKIENELKPPNPVLARRCDAELDAGGALSALVPAAPGPRVAEDSGDDEVWLMALDDGGDARHPLDRRRLLAGAGAMVGLAVTRGVRATIDEPVVTGLRASFEEHRRLGMLTSPAVVLYPVMSQVETLCGLAAGNSEPVRTQLLLLASRVAEYASWLSQEAGDERAALEWLRRAVVFAEAGQDRQLASYALVRKAEIALCRYDPLSTIELAQQAQAGRGVGPRIRGLAARCEAQGHALAGDGEACERALDRAAELLAVAKPAGIHGLVLGSSSVSDEVPLIRGWALDQLGRPGEAAALLDEYVAHIPVSARRARARFGSTRALAYARHGEVDHACLLAREVLADAVPVDSATIRSDLRQLAITLTRWRNHGPVRELYPELSRAMKPAQAAG